MRKNISIGELNERINLQREIQQKSDVSGSIQRVWKVYKNCWAKVVDLSGSEEIEGRILYVNTKVFTIRFDRSMLNATDRRVEYMGFYYNIVSVITKGKKQWMEIKANLENE